MLVQVGAAQLALTLGRPPAAHGQQTRQPAIGGAVGRQAQQARPVGQVEPAADHQPDTGALGGDMGTHDSGQTVPVGHRDGGVPQRRGAQRQFLGMGGAAQESEVGGNLKLGIDRTGHRRIRIGHGKTPCRYQRAARSC